MSRNQGVEIDKTAGTKSLATFLRVIIAVGLVTVAVGLGIGMVFLILLGYKYPWTGFASLEKPSEKFQPAKTLWDWMQLLIIPVVLGFGAAWFNQRREKLAKELEHRRKTEEKLLEHDRAREEGLQKFLDSIAELMLNKKLRRSKPNSEVRDIARARTLTVLRGMDTVRKSIIVRFLAESKLIMKIDVGNSTSDPVIGLSGVDLRGLDLPDTNLIWAVLNKTDLRDANLRKANLSGADLEEADLRDADFREVNFSEGGMFAASFWKSDLRGADLRGANVAGVIFSGTNLGGADLRGASGLDQEQLNSANGDKQTKIDGWLKRPTAWS